MKKIPLEFTREDRLAYPVGEDMIAAIKYINDLIIEIKKYNLFENLQYITLWGRGSSGAILSSLFAAKLIEMGIVVKIVHVRKEGESNHGNSYNIIKEEGVIDSYNIIIDDFISYGDTVNAIYEKFIKHNPTQIINMLIVQTINSIDCLKFVPACIISDQKGLNAIPEQEEEEPIEIPLTINLKTIPEQKDLQAIPITIEPFAFDIKIDSVYRSVQENKNI